jgi:hypothetical protein
MRSRQSTSSNEGAYLDDGRQRNGKADMMTATASSVSDCDLLPSLFNLYHLFLY